MIESEQRFVAMVDYLAAVLVAMLSYCFLKTYIYTFHFRFQLLGFSLFSGLKSNLGWSHFIILFKKFLELPKGIEINI